MGNALKAQTVLFLCTVAYYFPKIYRTHKRLHFIISKTDYIIHTVSKRIVFMSLLFWTDSPDYINLLIKGFRLHHFTLVSLLSCAYLLLRQQLKEAFGKISQGKILVGFSHCVPSQLLYNHTIASELQSVVFNLLQDFFLLLAIQISNLKTTAKV